MASFHFMSGWAAAAAAAAAAAEDTSDDAKDLARAGMSQVNDLRAQVDRLQMICEAMWTILKTKTGADEKQLAKLIEEIDLRDGLLDGKVAPTNAVTDCRKCGRVVSVRTGVCLYCGDRNAGRSVF